MEVGKQETVLAAGRGSRIPQPVLHPPRVAVPVAGLEGAEESSGACEAAWGSSQWEGLGRENGKKSVSVE